MACPVVGLGFIYQKWKCYQTDNCRGYQLNYMPKHPGETRTQLLKKQNIQQQSI